MIKKRVLALALVLCMAVGLLPATALAAATEDCPGGCEHKAAIGTIHYDTLAEALTEAKSKSGDVTVDLLTDMTLNDWTMADLTGKTFTSLTINGKGKTISGLSAPLFTDVNYPLTIKNLNVANPDISEEGYTQATGVLVDWHNSGLLTIQNCHVSGENTTYGISAGKYIGGLVGYSAASAKIENSSVKSLSLTSCGTVGSLVGLTNGNITIANCEIGGNIIETTHEEKQRIGAVIGTVTGTANNYISVVETAKSAGKCQGAPATLNVIGRLHRNVSYIGGSYFSDPCVVSEVSSGAVASFAGGNKVDTTAGKWTFADVATVQVGDEAPVTYQSLELALKEAPAGATVTLLTDLDLNGWPSVKPAANLTFDGGEHKITGLTAPLFHPVEASLVINNVTVENPAVVAPAEDFTAAGVLVGQYRYATATSKLQLTNCHVYGDAQTVSITSPAWAGGLVGYHNAIGSVSITNSSVKDIIIKSTAGAGTQTGGLVGLAASLTVTNCVVGNNKFYVTTGNAAYTGSVAGMTYGTGTTSSIDATEESRSYIYENDVCVDTALAVGNSTYATVVFVDGEYFEDPKDVSLVYAPENTDNSGQRDTLVKVKDGYVIAQNYDEMYSLGKVLNSGVTVVGPVETLEEIAPDATDIPAGVTIRKDADTAYKVTSGSVTVEGGKINVPAGSSVMVGDDIAVSGPTETDTDGKFSVTVPTVSSKPYNGSLQTSGLQNTAYYTVSESGGIAAGTYPVVLTLTDASALKWADGTEGETKTLTFTINQATAQIQGDVVLDKNTYYYGDTVVVQVPVPVPANSDGFPASAALGSGESADGPMAVYLGERMLTASAVSANNVYVLTLDTVALGLNAGTQPYTLSAKFAGDSNLTAAAKEFQITINQAPITVTANSVRKSYGQADPELTFSSVGAFGGQTPAFTGKLGRAPGEDVNSYAIDLGTLALTDNGTFLAGNFYLLQADTAAYLTIDAVNGGLTISTPNATVVGGGRIDLAVDVVPADGEVSVECSPAGATLVKNGDGTWTATLPNQNQVYTFTARYEGDENYSAAVATCTVEVKAYYYDPTPVTPVTPADPVEPENPAKPAEKPVVNPGKHPFTDVPDGEWYSDGVQYVYTYGMMNGVNAAGTLFDLYGDTSRAMLMTVLARLDGVDTSTGTTWDEVGTKWAVENGISDGTGGERSISREELVTMLWRYAGEPQVNEMALSRLSTYPDGTGVSPWAQKPMAWALKHGIINGVDGKLAPDASASRAMVATMLMRFCELSKR